MNGSPFDKILFKTIIVIIIVKSIAAYSSIVGFMIVAMGNWNQIATFIWMILFAVSTVIGTGIAFVLLIIVGVRTTKITSKGLSEQVKIAHKKVCNSLKELIIGQNYINYCIHACWIAMFGINFGTCQF